MKNVFKIILLASSGVWACTSDPGSMLEIPVWSTSEKQTVNVVIEIPAGDHLKTEYNKEILTFDVELRDGKPRSVDFLPYPVNYGFIPSTLSDKASGGDGDPLDAMLLALRLPTGSTVSALPLATLRLIDKGEQDDKVLLVPADSTLRAVNCGTLECLQTNYPMVIDILESWFLGYKGPGMMVSEGWIGTDETIQLIREVRVSTP